MAAGRIAVDATDPRAFAERPQIDVSFGGLDKTAGRNGLQELLPVVYGGAIFVRHKVVTATDVVALGDIPKNMALLGLHVLKTAAAGTATLALEEVAAESVAATTLATTQSLTTVGAKTFTSHLNPTTRKLTMTLASATVGAEILLAIIATPLDKAFR